MDVLSLYKVLNNLISNLPENIACHFTLLLGLAAATKDMAVISNNLANTQTTGFKRSSAKFEDVFATMPGTKASTATGVGTAVASVDQEFSRAIWRTLQMFLISLSLAMGSLGFC